MPMYMKYDGIDLEVTNDHVLATGDLNGFIFDANSGTGGVDHDGIAWVSGAGGTRGAPPVRPGEFIRDVQYEIGPVGTTIATETITIVHEGFF